MKPAIKFRQYIWIINTLRAYKRLTFVDLQEKWEKDDMGDGSPLQRSSFNRYRDDIVDMFGIIIDCEPRTYKYYISNQDVLADDSIERWLYSTLSVHGMLADSASVKDRIMLENVPAGEEFQQTILRAIKANRRLRTLPLHHSQRELASTEHYTDFSFDIRPTADFLDELLKHGDGIEILEPLDLREKMRQMLLTSLKRYEE